jgi:hypothetical protein
MAQFYFLREFVNIHSINSTQILRTCSDNRLRKFIRWTKLLYTKMKLYKGVSNVASNVLNVRRRGSSARPEGSWGRTCFAPYGHSGLYPGGMPAEREIHHLNPSSSEIWEAWTLLLLKIYAFMVWCLCTGTIFMYFIMTPSSLCLKWMLPLRL